MQMNVLARIVAASCLAAVSAPAAATDWTKTATLPDGTAIYVDRDSISRSGSHVLAWEKWDYTAAPRNPNRAYAVEKDRREHDCAAGGTRLREAIEYDANGDVLKSYSWASGESQYRASPPESVGEATQKFVCGGASNPPPG
ncbi:surface-adhesin E family protein [Sphingomonas sp. PB2P12]|uniref:surface-adhesin E family protein n=1 Tax=Sphingomonas sandaracina TaxID=3096157 RepID=UPI003FA76FA1